MIVTGRLRQRTYETGDGVKRTDCELDATDVGISLQRTTARPVKAERQSGGNGGQAERVCTKCGERHKRYGPNGRPCDAQAKATDEPPS
jgi:single-stranded DNA-binding protein